MNSIEAMNSSPARRAGGDGEGAMTEKTKLTQFTAGGG